MRLHTLDLVNRDLSRKFRVTERERDVQWNLSNLEQLVPSKNVLNREVSTHWRLENNYFLNLSMS